MMFELPMRAFCIMGRNDKDRIEMTIDKVFGFPETTTFEGGYEFKGSLTIHASSYKVYSQNYYSSTGALYDLYISLVKCYDLLEGTAKYALIYEKDLEFELEMTQTGHAIINGEYTEIPHISNTLVFQIDTDQSYIRDAIDDLERVIALFGDNTGKIK